MTVCTLRQHSTTPASWLPEGNKCDLKPEMTKMMMMMKCWILFTTEVPVLICWK